MSRLMKPVDKVTAKEVMKKFSEMAYSVTYLPVFQEAVNIMYGREFIVCLDLSRRMQFSCQICSREMNSENAMAEHFRSGQHQKNLDRKLRQSGATNYSVRSSNYSRDSLQYALLQSHIPPIGLQMIEEYINSKGNTYYKCFLCGAYGKMAIMYQHIINKTHTEKYIKTAVHLENSILTANEREEIRKKIVSREGINVEAIKTIRGNEFYPYKWEAETFVSARYASEIKREQQQSSPRYRSSSSSSSSSDSGHKSKNRRRKSRSVTPKWRRYSRSPDSSRWSSRSPPIRDRSSNRHPRESRKKQRSGNSNSSPEHHLGQLQIKQESNVANETSDFRRENEEFRNRSPPPSANVKSEPLSPKVKSEAMSPGQMASTSGNATFEVPLVQVKKETSNVAVQTQPNLDPLMRYLAAMVKEPIDSLKTSQEVREAMDLMDSIADSLRLATLSDIEESSQNKGNLDTLLEKKEKLEKVLSYTRKWYLPTWEKEIFGKY